MIGIVTVGYNNQEDLNDYFDSIYASTYKDFNVYFVDNHSSDNSVEYIKQHYPQVIIIKNKHNEGFAKANNRGIEVAKKDGAHAIFFLNPDTILDDKCLAQLQASFNPNTIIQPLILLHENNHKTDLINTAGNPLHYLGISYAGSYKKHKKKAMSSSIVSASGAACLFPCSILEKIGGFDELFFMYHEDLDLCWRAQMRGYEIKLDVGALVWHKYRFSKSAKKMYYIERNRLLFILKNYQVRTIVCILPMAIVHEIVACMFALKGRWLVYKIRSYIDTVLLLPQILDKRMHAVRKLSDHKLKKYFSATLFFGDIGGKMLYYYNSILSWYWKCISPLI